MGEIAILLMSHGNFAKSAIESAELIVGKQNNYEVLSVFLVDQVDTLKEKMYQKINKLDTGNGLLVLTDIIGGTPNNLAGNLINRSDTVICSGLNMPMLLEILTNRNQELSYIEELIKSSYQAGLFIRNTNLIEEYEEGDDDSL
ncbi:PTS sugar transporter subunit IIA [Xylocopilactobacillus apis]|uniref:PTS mannose transporter subunit IIAB n=1 Tax=Xylocopilactobacillus apis TaxID=2932183 RepID=A0AAU9DQM1_9LACO|nr:PTS sugar transporter subunit IIA [Xylocopilactobacillus apis]BDR55893.1 PTS mannose transporter subunit IIAB [Xylocopilactobacillus apis]